MSRRTRIDYTKLAAELVKAGGVRLPAGAVVTSEPPSLAAAGLGGVMARPLAPGGWTDPLVAFGPGKPVRPAAIDPLDPLSGRPLPRRYDYPVSVNLPGVADRVVPFTLLRRLADASIIRRCIEIRKAEMIAQEWDITVSPLAIQLAMAKGSQSPADARRSAAALSGDPQALVDQKARQGRSARATERDLRERNAGEIGRLKAWWKHPDRRNDQTFDDWLMVALEEHFVLDALTIFPRMTLGGELHSLTIIAGDTIKPLLDHEGCIPQPPNPAYQQILHGFPRGEFTATADADDEYDRDTLIYRPRYRRANSPYGLSNTEQAIVNADLYMKRIEWIRSEYTAGVIPEMFIEVDVAMTPDQLIAYERIFNDMLTGQTEERHRAKIMPQGFTPKQLQNFEERYRPDYDLHLIRLIGNDFDVMPSELGFPPNGGLGGKGLSEGEENITYRKGTRPLTKWMVGTLDHISQQWLGAPQDLTFKFLGLESEDESLAQQIMESQFKNAGLTANEMRDQVGLPRFNISDADVPFIITGRDIVPLEGSVDRANAAAAAVLAGAQQQEAAPALGEAGGTATSTPVNPKPSGDVGDDTTSAYRSKSAELETFRKYTRRRRAAGRPWRDFEFHDEPPEVAAVLNKMAADGEEI